MPALRLARRRDRVEIALSGTRSMLGRAQWSRQTNSASAVPAGPRRVALIHEAARTLHRSPGQRSRQPRQRLARHRESQDGSERTRTSSWRRGRWRRRSGRSKTFRLPPSRRLRIFGTHASLYACVPDANWTGRLHSVHVSCRNRPTTAQQRLHRQPQRIDEARGADPRGRRPIVMRFRAQAADGCRSSGS